MKKGGKTEIVCGLLGKKMSTFSPDFELPDEPLVFPGSEQPASAMQMDEGAMASPEPVLPAYTRTARSGKRSRAGLQDSGNSTRSSKRARTALASPEPAAVPQIGGGEIPLALEFRHSEPTQVLMERLVVVPQSSASSPLARSGRTSGARTREEGEHPLANLTRREIAQYDDEEMEEWKALQCDTALASGSAPWLWLDCLTRAPARSALETSDLWVNRMLELLMDNACSENKTHPLFVYRARIPLFFLAVHTVGDKCAAPSVLFITPYCAENRLRVSRRLPYSLPRGLDIGEIDTNGNVGAWLGAWVQSKGPCAHFLRFGFRTDRTPQQLSEAFEADVSAKTRQSVLGTRQAVGSADWRQFVVPLHEASKDAEEEKGKRDESRLPVPGHDWSAFLALTVPESDGRPALASLVSLGSAGRLRDDTQVRQAMATVFKLIYGNAQHRHFTDVVTSREANFVYLSKPLPLNRPAVLLLAGSKATGQDLTESLDEDIAAQADYQGLSDYASGVAKAALDIWGRPDVEIGEETEEDRQKRALLD